jgi:hypothetical protein
MTRARQEGDSKIFKQREKCGRNKKKANRLAPIRPCKVALLESYDVRGLEALGAFGHFEFNGLTLVEGLVAIGHDRGEMDENVLSRLALDESEALASIEPLYCSLFFHLYFLF